MTLFNRPGLPAYCDELSTAFQRARPTNQTVRPQYRYTDDIFGEVFDQLRSFCTGIFYPVLAIMFNIFSTSIRGSLSYLLSHIIRYPVIPAREQNKNVSQAFTQVHYQSTGVTTCFGVYLPMGSWWSSSVALLEAFHMRCRCTRIAPME